MQCKLLCLFTYSNKFQPQKIHNKYTAIYIENTDMTTLRVIWRFRGREKSTQTSHRGLAEDSQSTHTDFTEDSQRTRSELTEDSQRTHRGLTEDLLPLAEDSQRTHRGFTEDSQRIH